MEEIRDELITVLLLAHESSSILKFVKNPPQIFIVPCVILLEILVFFNLILELNLSVGDLRSRF